MLCVFLAAYIKFTIDLWSVNSHAKEFLGSEAEKGSNCESARKNPAERKPGRVSEFRSGLRHHPQPLVLKTVAGQLGFFYLNLTIDGL